MSPDFELERQVHGPSGGHDTRPRKSVADSLGIAAPSGEPSATCNNLRASRVMWSILALNGLPIAEAGPVILAFVFGVLGSLPFLFLGQVWAYASVGAAGLVAAWLVADRPRGLRGLLLGVATPFTIYGAYEVVRKIESCGPSACTGLSAPELTAAIVVGFALIGLAAGLAGYVLGRFGRAVVLRSIRRSRSPGVRDDA